MFQTVVFFIGHGFEPFVLHVFPVDFNCQVGKPAVGGRTVPVFDSGRNVDDGARKDFLCFLAFLLIPAASVDAYQHLPSAFSGLVDMPVVAASRFKRDMGNIGLLVENREEVAVAKEIF